MKEFKVEDKLLHVNELKELLNLTSMTIYRYRKQGMPHVRVNRNVIRYKYEDVVNWLQNKEVK